MAAACEFTGLKECNVCHERKDVRDFSKDKSRKDGKQPRCKTCYGKYKKDNQPHLSELSRVWSANWRASHRDVLNAQARRRYHADPARSMAITKRWVEQNPEKHAEHLVKYRQINKSKIYAANAKRRAMRILATVSWANEDLMREFYDAAQCLSRAFGTPWHVDHIVPLNSDIVCGLHCEANLQLLPGDENIRKSNHYWPDMP